MASRASIVTLGAALVAAVTGCIPSGVARSAMDPVFPTGAPMDPSGAMRLVSTPDEAVRSVTAPSIREVSARGISRSAPRVLPVDSYAPMDPEPIARYSSLPSTHLIAADTPLPVVTSPRDLRQLVGRRDKRDALAAMLAFTRDLGAPQGYAETSGAEVVAWAAAAGRLGDRETHALPGDVIVFDRAVGDGSADLFAIVVERDARGVTEIVYLGNGVYRRGFVDVTRPRTRRDDHQRPVNTYLRHGKKWPAKGTRYLSGELIANVIRMSS